MPKVTIGVPVYNGADQLADCLDCLVNQSFEDIAILIFDNASTDDTQAIIEDFAGRDARITYTRRPENVGPIKNFIEPLERAQSPFFMWRAHDDLSAPDYVEKLVAALEAQLTARLATGTIQFERPGGRPARRFVPHIPDSGIAALDILRLMFGSHAGWYYGLWHTQTLQALVRRVWTEFPHAWASDHLTLYPLLLDRQVTAAPQTTFIQRVTPKAHGPRQGVRHPLANLVKLRREFLACCDRMVEERNFDLPTRTIIEAANRLYIGKRVYPLRKIIKRTLLRR